MKRLLLVLVVFVFTITQFALAGNKDRLASTNWDAFSKNLVMAIASGNDGLQQSAMQQIITYSDYLDVENARFDLVHLYRFHNNERVRQLAVVTLHKIGNKWAMDFLKRNLKFEDNPTIYRQIVDCMYRDQQSSGVAADQKESEIIFSQKIK